MAVFIALIFFFSSSAFGQSDGLSPGQRRLQRTYHDRIGWHLVNGVWVQASGQCNWSDLIRLNWRGQHLMIEAKPTNAAVGLLRGGRTAAVEIGIAKDLYQLAAPEIPRGGQVPAVRNPVELRPGEQAIYLTATELPEADRIENPRSPLSLVAAPNVLRVLAEGDVDGARVTVSFMSQQPAGVQLKVSEVGRPESSPLNFSIKAQSLDELHEMHRAQVRTYLGPLLRNLRGPDARALFAPGAADVYAVFEEIEPTPEAIISLNEILPAMLDPDYDVRQNALAALRKLGPAGVCAILRTPRDQLAPQQRIFVELVLKENSRRDDPFSGERDDRVATELAQLRRDRHFLIDCLEFTDARVRELAIRELSELLHRPIDPNIAQDARASVKLANELRVNAK